jgi:hypothetical protein
MWGWIHSSLTLKSVIMRGWGADKFLLRPGRKQATAAKLGIYSTYSPRSLIHLPVALMFESHSKKISILSVQSGLHGSNDLRFRLKMSTFQLFFQSMEQVVGQRGQIRRIGWVIKKLEAKAGQFLLCCKCPVSRDIVVQEQDNLGEFPEAFFL